MVRRVTGPWNAAALPEIVAGALEESKRGGKQARRKASSMCLFRFTKAEQQASNQAALPEPEGVERQKPERGLTLRLTGVPKARPS